MTIDRIRKHFERKGYKIVTCKNGRYGITPRSGFGKVFDSLSAAHKYYFNY